MVTRKKYKIDFATNLNNAKLVTADSSYLLPATIVIRRSKNDLNIKLVNDSISINYTIESSINPEFLIGNLAWLSLSPFAYLVDFTNQKRFYYGRNIYFNATDTTRIIKTPVTEFIHEHFVKTYSVTPKEFFLNVSIPYINSFNFKPENEATKINTGFWGLTLGLDYYHSKKQFCTIGLSTVSDFFVPIPAAIDISGEYESMSSTFLSLSNNHKIGRFSIGYGLTYAKNSWSLKYSDSFDAPPPTREPVKKSNLSIGLVFPIYYQLGRQLNIGVLYRPTFFRPLSKNKFLYEQLVSIDLAFKFKLRK